MSILGFDHFVIVVNDLDAAMDSFRRLGFEVNPGGEHPAFGSHNAIISLADGSYLELVAFKDAALAATSFWRDAARMLRVGEGFAGYVFGSNELASDVAELAKQSVRIGSPTTGSRTRPDGQRVEWQTAILEDTPSGALPFLIQDVTPRPVRVQPAQAGLGSRARVKEVVVAVKNADLLRGPFRALLGVEPRRVHNAADDVEGYRFAMPWGAVVLASPTRGGHTMFEQLTRRGEGLYALTLLMPDVNPARRTMKQRSVPVEDETYGFMISPDAACGARIRLLQE
ncbi:MAG: VOC family protein [Chloroflexi bacterium]|nr:VOC family protein [Chloroflexota bacterium]